jgi:PAS domain-containing protein
LDLRHEQRGETASAMSNERRIAEEALRESEQRWRSLTEALPQLVWSATPDRRVRLL